VCSEAGASEQGHQFIPEGFEILAGGKRSATTGHKQTQSSILKGCQNCGDSGIPPGCKR